MEQPQVIFLDAVGTLFGVRGSVGEIYGDIARQFGVEADGAALNQAFFKSFRAAPPMAFPGMAASAIAQHEFDWWQAIAAQTFQQVGLFDQFSDFTAFFASLYGYFATIHPWFVYPDIHQTLSHWRSQGIELGVLSNFDSRLYPVMDGLELSEFFTSVTISTEVGAAKPDPQMFAAALKKHGCRPADAWHIGDSFREDYEGAKTAGLRAIWLRRKDPL